MAGLWTEACVTWPTIEMLGAGYNIYVVEDCCGATSQAAQEAALSRMVQAGAVRTTTIAALLEWQRDWKNREHYDNLMGILKGHAGAYARSCQSLRKASVASLGSGRNVPSGRNTPSVTSAWMWGWAWMS
jgi:hypothetical protein